MVTRSVLEAAFLGELRKADEEQVLRLNDAVQAPPIANTATVAGLRATTRETSISWLGPHKRTSTNITRITIVMGCHVPSSAQGQRVTVAVKPPPQIRGPDHLRGTELP